MKARLPQGYGKPDVNALMRQAQKMQEDMKTKQEELENTKTSYQQAIQKADETVTAEQALEIVARYRSEGRALKEACKLAAADTGFGKNELYQMALNA